MKIAKFAVAAGLAAIALGFGISQANAWPVGPSARAAARLKYNPPKNWIEHYLGDDRYKVVGGVWKVVSTDLDSYYHRPDCPHMLRQDAGQVIGFASPADAQEAGYTADRSCSPDAAEVMFAGSPLGGQSGGTFLLADKASSITMPSGWKRVVNDLLDLKGLRIGIDGFESKSGKVAVTTLDMPPVMGMEISQFVKPEMVRKYQARSGAGGSVFDSTGVINNQLSSVFKSGDTLFQSARIAPFTASGMTGTSIIYPKGKGPDGRRAVHMVGRGNKIYMITDLTKDGKGMSTIIKSLKAQ